MMPWSGASAQGGKKQAGNEMIANSIIEARRALGDGLPQIAAVKASRLLETKGLSKQDKIEIAGIIARLTPAVAAE